MHIHTAKAGRPGGTSLLIGSEGLAYGDPPTGPVPTGHISAGPDFMPLLLWTTHTCSQTSTARRAYRWGRFQRIKVRPSRTNKMSTSTSKASADKFHVWLFYTGHWNKQHWKTPNQVIAYLAKIIQVTQYMWFRRQNYSPKMMLLDRCKLLLR